MISLRAAGRHRAQRQPLSTPSRSRTRKWVSTAVIAAVAVSPGLALAVTSSSTSSATTNLVKNPGFESGTQDWRTNSSAQRLAAVSSAHGGSYAAKLTVTTTSDAVLNDKTNSVQSTPSGAVYTARAYVRTTTPGVTGRLRLREVSGTTMVAKGSTAFTLSDTAWHQVTLTYDPARTGSALDLNVYAIGLKTTQSLQVDDVSLVAGASATVVADPTPSPTSTSISGCTISAILVPSCGAWFGVGVNPLSGESYHQALLNFEATTGRTAGIVHFYHGATSLFPSSSEISLAR